MFAGLMSLDMLVLGLLSMRYEYVDYSNEVIIRSTESLEEDDDQKD